MIWCRSLTTARPPHTHTHTHKTQRHSFNVAALLCLPPTRRPPLRLLAATPLSLPAALRSSEPTAACHPEPPTAHCPLASTAHCLPSNPGCRFPRPPSPPPAATPAALAHHAVACPFTVMRPPNSHDLVPPVAADAPTTTIHASSPRRDPLEDEDASFTRKRPRLDGGPTSRRAMSADPDPAALLFEQPLEMTIRPHPPSPPPPVAAHDPDNAPIEIVSEDDDIDDDDDDDEDDDYGSPSPPLVVIDDDDDHNDDDNVNDDAAAFILRPDADDHFCRFPYARSSNCCAVARDVTLHIEKGWFARGTSARACCANEAQPPRSTL